MSTKETMINQTHSDYAQMITVVGNALEAVNNAKKVIGSMDPKSAGTILICLKNMSSELGNINSALAKDYIEELETYQKRND
jgi:hypothetical protein